MIHSYNAAFTYTAFNGTVVTDRTAVQL